MMDVGVKCAESGTYESEESKNSHGYSGPCVDALHYIVSG